MEAVLNQKELRQIKVTVRVPRLMHWRMWVGLRIVRLGVRVFGAALEVEQG